MYIHEQDWGRNHWFINSYDGDDDDKAIELAFSSKMIEARKEWIQKEIKERRQKRNNGEKDSYSLWTWYTWSNNQSAAKYSDT